MGIASRRKKENLKIGEIIRARSIFGIPPSGIYQVDRIEEGMLHLSVGRIQVGVMPQAVQVLERHLPKPRTWLHSEIALIKAQLELCDCEQCKLNLIERERELSQWEQKECEEMIH